MEKNLESIISEYRKKITFGEDIDTIILQLHESGISILDSIKVIRALYGMNLNEAKKIVSEHPIWAHMNHQLSSTFLNVVALGPESTYGDWLEVYRFGLPQKGRFHISTDNILQSKINALLHRAMDGEGATKVNLIQQIVHYSDTVIYALIALLDGSDDYLWDLVLLAIHEIGFPKNVLAIPWLIDIALDSQPTIKDQAIKILKDDMPANEVSPFFIAMLMNRDKENDEWGASVDDVCRLLLQKKEWAIASGPSIAYLLVRSNYLQNQEIDKESLLRVLEFIPFPCVYTLPTLYHLAFHEKDGKISKIAQNMLSLFTEDELLPYRYCLGNV